ncbi:MAG: hypothetical protein HY424_02465 [Candidatus Levybacteria bacterium]|nr:hypothetical protein [Candidatus Levybacteria bacterium]
MTIRNVENESRPTEMLDKLQEYRPFTDKEKEMLKTDGTEFYILDGKETIEGQIKAQKPFAPIINGDGLLKLPSLKAEVAIYRDPKRFFVPNTGNKDLATQEVLVKRDVEELRKRTGLGEDIDEIIPDQASTLTAIIFKHFDKTTREGNPVWLFGSEYASAQRLKVVNAQNLRLGYQNLNWVCGRTRNAVDKSGSRVATVGFQLNKGVIVDFWSVDHGCPKLFVVRLIVARKR